MALKRAILPELSQRDEGARQADRQFHAQWFLAARWNCSRALYLDTGSRELSPNFGDGRGQAAAA